MIVHEAAWAPDGQTIYVAARNIGIARHAYAVTARDGAVRRLTISLAAHRELAVSPDERWLACAVG
jgi:hypothetical protein